MEAHPLSHFLPSGLLNYFTVVEVKEVASGGLLGVDLEIYLDENNKLLREDAAHYESKGFGPVTKIQDFPIRGKKVYLCLRRRKWRHKELRNVVSNDYNLRADGARMTKELSDFLKDARRKP